jgi:hypothetical protein
LRQNIEDSEVLVKNAVQIGQSPEFMHIRWCLDYFRYCWYGAGVFEEGKLKE